MVKFPLPDFTRSTPNLCQHFATHLRHGFGHLQLQTLTDVTLQTQLYFTIEGFSKIKQCNIDTTDDIRTS